MEVSGAGAGLGLLFDTHNWADGASERGWRQCAGFATAVHIKTFAFDAEGNDVTSTGRGQPAVKGPVVSPGYHAAPEANAKLVRPDGWVMLGDLVELDEDGYLHVIGRTDDIIIRGGKNLSAATETGGA